jgi:redox-sensitive bicupin YhaK (pirin superfamily)
LSWRPDFNALVYVLSGRGVAGAERPPVHDHQLVVFGPGDTIRVAADPRQESRHHDLELLVLGGCPIREPVVHYGPFVVNTRAEIAQALEDYQAGRLGQVPATERPHRQPDDIVLTHPEETHPGETHPEENGERRG